MAMRTTSSTRGRLPCSRFGSMSDYGKLRLLAPAVGPTLEPGLGDLSRVSGGAAGASGGGAAGSAGAGGAGPAAGSAGT
eukprot:7304481-Pyramimonas_sp.AAC.1